MAVNRIMVSWDTPAMKQLLSGGIGEVRQLLRSLSSLRSDPTPDGETKISVLMAPVVMYYYDDGEYKISYGLSHYPKDDRYDIRIYSVARSS